MKIHWFRRVGWITFGATLIHPIRQSGYLPRIEADIILQGQSARDGPGGHFPAGDIILDVAGPVQGILIGQQLERGDIIGPVAALAVLCNNGSTSR